MAETDITVGDIKRAVMVEGAQSFALWLTRKHDLPVKGINKNLQEWEKDEFDKVHRTPRK